MATYAIGDVQGCYGALMRLLDKLRFSPGRDRLWFAGDLINRGPESLKVLREVMALGDSAVTVLGNHDLHFLAVAEGVRHASNSDTLSAVLAAPDCPEICLWLRHKPLIHTDASLGYTLVHAGIPPMWGLNKALRRAAEVQTALTDERYRDFLAAMYGDEPAGWRPGLEGLARLRVITNYFTRMRFCSPDGQLDLANKSGPMSVVEGFAPWYALENRKTRGQKIIFGHWAALEGNTAEPGIFALDTGCVWGGCLTALCLETQERISVSCD